MVKIINEYDNNSQGSLDHRESNDIYLADLYNNKGNYEKGIEYIKIALTLEPQQIFYQILLGQLYENNNQTEQAINTI